MSISDPIKLVNPAQRFYQWSGSKGVWQFYDKETKSNVPIPVSFQVIVLDQLSTITGFDSVSESGIYSNEIHFFNEILTVKSHKGGEIVKGLYQEITPKLASVGAKYAKSVYCAVIRQGKPLEIINIKFSGSALSSLIESKVRDGDTLELSPSTEVLKKGATKYFAPKVVKVNTEVVLFQESLELDRTQLKPFFAQYKKAVPEIVINSVIEDDLPVFDTSDYTPMPY